MREQGYNGPAFVRLFDLIRFADYFGYSLSWVARLPPAAFSRPVRDYRKAEIWRQLSRSGALARRPEWMAERSWFDLRRGLIKMLSIRELESIAERLGVAVETPAHVRRFYRTRETQALWVERVRQENAQAARRQNGLPKEPVLLHHQEERPIMPEDGEK